MRHTGCKRFELQITAYNTLTITNDGRVYDSAASTFYFYYMPSLVVNTNGDMVMGFSGSRSTEHIGAFYTGRLANGSMPVKPILIQAGRTPFADLWGDYSFTSLDPDGQTFWTVQEYAEVLVSDTTPRWGTEIAKIKK